MLIYVNTPEGSTERLEAKSVVVTGKGSITELEDGTIIFKVVGGQTISGQTTIAVNKGD